MAAIMRRIRLALFTLEVSLGILFVKASTNFCGSVFETQIGKLATTKQRYLLPFLENASTLVLACIISLALAEFYFV